ncbi:MAG: L-threonylcarbamoyladenylate synthase [Candidatus Thorarchaeota archaeon]
MTRRQVINPENPDIRIIGEVAALIKTGHIVVLPTDTAYGLTGDPSNAEVVHRILAVKEREKKLGMPLLAANLQQVRDLVILSPLAEAVATQVWPGAVTLVVSARQRFPQGILGPENSLAVRIPNHPVPLKVIQTTGFPIIGTSANKSNTTSPRTADAAATQLTNLVDYILDGGPTQYSADSTIVNLTRDPPEIIREGAVSRVEINRILKIGAESQ